MNKRLRNKLRWYIMTHYNGRPWITHEYNQPKTRFNQLVRQAAFDDTIDHVYACQMRYQKIRVPGGMLLIEKGKVRSYVPRTNRPYFRRTVKWQFFVANDQLGHYAKLRERYHSPTEESENE